jgi:hypothetical protein
VKTTATLFTAILLLVGCSLTASARSFTVSISPKNQTTNNAPVSYTIAITPKDGFAASVFLSASSPTLKAELKLSSATVNTPYSPGPLLTVTPVLPKQPGTHIIVVEGKNGPVVVRDTCTLTITLPGNGGWINYTTGNSTLPTDTITAVAADRNGTLWAGTNRGLARFDGTNWYPVDDSVDGGKRITAIAIDSTNNVWVVVGGPPGQLKRFANGVWSTYAQSIYTIAAAGDSSVWALDYKSVYSGHLGLVQHRPGKISVYGNYPGKDWGAPFLVSDTSGRAWLLCGYRKDSLVSVDYDGVFWTAGTSISVGNWVSGLAIDRQNRVWIGRGEAVTVYSDTAQPISYQPFEEDTWETEISQFGFDYQGHTWIGMGRIDHGHAVANGNGLGRHDGTKWWHYTTANSPLLSDDITGISVSPSTIWVGTHGGGLLAIDANASPDALLSVPAQGRTSPAAIKPHIYPNPVDRAATVRISLDIRINTDIELRDALGRKIMPVASGIHEAGELHFTLDTDQLPPGVYYLCTSIGGYTSAQPVVVVH